ncbi:MAG: hypothetical protein ETSY1_03765 [Candidatus Entotheonella factor]|uniref:HicB-like antitoxin of toxin-antitoxin system domain-containing protein n=1 Tax=Entotheonella factor TaxID=1429438 RepID=W4LWA9_ENTF1|nr:MAG: hypothetical protein ETSY1_03765 [Candidatus Entotheonella factor]
MTYDVLLTQKGDKFIAQICQWPGIIAESHTEAEALRQVQADLKAFLANGRIVQLEVNTNSQEHPWQPFAGMFADDPDWDAFQESIREYYRFRK